MNLNAYDSIKEKLDKNKTWIDISRKTIYSREITPRRYTCLLKRYNSKTNTNSYFIAMLNSPPLNKNYLPTICDDYGRVKIKVGSIWNDTYLSLLDCNCNIMCNLVESGDDGDVYSIDI